MRHAIIDVRTGIIVREHGVLESAREEFFPFEKVVLNGQWSVGDLVDLSTYEVIRPQVIPV
jgi:hypothetical protein